MATKIYIAILQTKDKFTNSPYLIFQNTRSMQRLNLANNWLKMENMEALFRKLPNLEDVNLSSSRLVTVPTSVFETNPRIKHFNVSDNYLISMQIGVFNHLHWLESLDLSSNYFMDLSEEFFSEVRRKSTLKMIYLQVLGIIRFFKVATK